MSASNGRKSRSPSERSSSGEPRVAQTLPDLQAVLEADPQFERDLLVSETTETLRALMKTARLTQRELARRLRVSDARLSRIMSGNANLTLGTLAEIGWAEGVRFEIVAVPIEDTSKTPAANDPPPAPWIRRHAHLVAERADAAFERLG